LPDIVTISSGSNAACDTAKSDDACYNFHDINWVVFKLKTAIAINTA